MLVSQLLPDSEARGPGGSRKTPNAPEMPRLFPGVWESAQGRLCSGKYRGAKEGEKSGRGEE